MNALISAWNWPYLLLSLSGISLILFFWLLRPRSAGRIAAFLAGLILLNTMLASPLTLLARQYLLSTEAWIHVTSAVVAPLLLIAGLPRPTESSPAAKNRYVPYAGWILGMGTISIWYLPTLFNKAITNGWLWDLMQITLVLGGIAFWWPLFDPRRKRRVKPIPTGIWYLFAATIWCSFVGMVVAFIKEDTYQPYVRVQDTLGILPFIRTDLELTRGSDQETGGMVLWLGTMAVFLTAVMQLFYRWYYSQDVRQEFATAGLSTEKKAREDQA